MCNPSQCIYISIHPSIYISLPGRRQYWLPLWREGILLPEVCHAHSRHWSRHGNIYFSFQALIYQNIPQHNNRNPGCPIILALVNLPEIYTRVCIPGIWVCTWQNNFLHTWNWIVCILVMRWNYSFNSFNSDSVSLQCHTIAVHEMQFDRNAENCNFIAFFNKRPLKQKRLASLKSECLHTFFL